MGFLLSSSWYPAMNIKHCNERPKGPMTSNMNSCGQQSAQEAQVNFSQCGSWEHGLVCVSFKE
jgi:hypothetical protein